MTAETTVPAPQQQQQNRAENAKQETTRAEEMYFMPPADIFEDEHGLVLLIDLPGVDRDFLEVRTDRGVLTIQGQAHHLAPGDPIYREFQLQGYFRQFQLPEDMDTEKVEAVLKNGVLRIQVPRAEKAQPRRIDVRTS